MRFLLDENVALSLTAALTEAGHEARHVITIGRRGSTDEEIFALAQANDEVVISNDLDFSDERAAPSGHSGIIILRVWPNISPDVWTADVVARVSTLSEAEVRGNIVVLEPGSTRIRKRES